VSICLSSNLLGAPLLSPGIGEFASAMVQLDLHPNLVGFSILPGLTASAAGTKAARRVLQDLPVFPPSVGTAL